MVCALIVGLAWEHTFDVALETAMEGSTGGPTQKKVIEMAIGFFLVLIFLPGFGVIMMPKYNDELKGQFANTAFAPWQVCCDFPCDESTEDDGKGYKEEDAEDLDPD